jgi:hypothetical protein
MGGVCSFRHPIITPTITPIITPTITPIITQTVTPIITSEVRLAWSHTSVGRVIFYMAEN